MNFDTAVYLPDDRFDYGEARTQVIGCIGGRLHVLVFTERGDAMRVISLRKADQKELRRCAKEA